MNGRKALLIGALALLALIALVPLRLVMGLAAPDGVTARSVEGTVWSGRIADLKAGPFPVGTVETGLEVAPLLLGQARVRVAREGFAARASLGSEVRMDGASGTIALPDGLGELPVTALVMQDLSVAMAGGACREASGTLGLTLGALGPLLPDALRLSGTARCEKGALVVPMRSAEDTERLTLQVMADGRWQAELVLNGLPQETRELLLQSGFEARPGGIGIGTGGKL
ncbi:MAG: type II secretion system protein N [Novosphingobium sp.]